MTEIIATSKGHGRMHFPWPQAAALNRSRRIIGALDGPSDEIHASTPVAPMRRHADRRHAHECSLPRHQSVRSKEVPSEGVKPARPAPVAAARVAGSASQDASAKRCLPVEVQRSPVETRADKAAQARVRAESAAARSTSTSYNPAAIRQRSPVEVLVALDLRELCPTSANHPRNTRRVEWGL